MLQIEQLENDQELELGEGELSPLLLPTVLEAQRGTSENWENFTCFQPEADKEYRGMETADFVGVV